MGDRIWNDLKEDGFNKVVQEICLHVRFRLSKLYTTLKAPLLPKETKPEYLRDPNEERPPPVESRREYKYKGVVFNIDNMASIIMGEINFKYISDAIEEHITVTMN